MKPDTRLRDLSTFDLDVLLEWRNAESVRIAAYSSHIISRNEHLLWYQGINEDPKRHPLIFELDGVPVGFVNLGPVRTGGIAAWSFFASPDAPRGTGQKLGTQALGHAFDVLQLHKICGEVLGFNLASRHLHAKLGFRQEGCLVDQHFDGSTYHDVICFGLTHEEWEARPAGEHDAPDT